MASSNELEQKLLNAKVFFIREVRTRSGETNIKHNNDVCVHPSHGTFLHPHQCTSGSHKVSQLPPSISSAHLPTSKAQHKSDIAVFQRGRNPPHFRLQLFPAGLPSRRERRMVRSGGNVLLPDRHGASNRST